MNKTNRTKTIRMTAGFFISAVFLFFIFKHIDINQMFLEIRQIRAGLLVPAILVYFGGVWVRTARWRIIMRPLTNTKTVKLFPVYMISYMVNNILPLRIGDIYRAYIAGHKEKISKSATLVTIGVERIFDGLTMLFLLIISIMYFPIQDELVRKAVAIGSYLFLGAIIVSYILVLRKTWAEWVFNRLLILTKTKDNRKITDLFENLFSGLESLRRARDTILVIVLSLATWLIEAYSYYLVLNAFGFYGTFVVAIATMALVNLMIVVPSAPGYFGPFEMACFIILGRSGYGELTGFTGHVAAAYALIVHVIVQWIPSTLLGMIFMWKEHIKFKDIETSDGSI